MKRKILISAIMFLIAILPASVYAIQVEGYPELPEFEQEHYIIYLEASRDNRVELAAFDISEEDENDCVVWDEELQLYYNYKYKNGVKWYLDGDKWTLFEEGYYCISNNPAGVIASDVKVMDIRDWNQIDPRIEVIPKSEPEHPHLRYKYNNQLVWFTEDTKSSYLHVSDDGINEVKKMPIRIPPIHVMFAGGNMILIGHARPIETTVLRFRKGTFGNSPALVLNSSFETVNTIDYNGYSEYYCKAGDRLYVKNSDYSNITSMDLGGDYYSKIIVKYYYTDDGGMTWSEASEEEAKAAKDGEIINQDNYLGYNVIERGEYIQSKSNPEKKYKIVTEHEDTNVFEDISGSFNSYFLSRLYGKKRYYGSDPDRPYGRVRDKSYISLDGVYGIPFPYINYYTVWFDKDYLYMDIDEEKYYRIPMKYFTDNVIVTYGDKALAFETPPVIENGRTLVPMRFLFEQMGAEVSWDEATQTATVKKQDDIISFSIDNASAEVNNELKTMEVPARLIDGKTMIPMRFLSEALGYTVEWDEATRTASVIEK